MSILHRLGIGRRKAAAPSYSLAQWIGVAPSEIAEGIDAGDPKAYQVNAWVYTCVNAIAQAAATAPLMVETLRGKEWVEAEGTPIGALLDYVNADDDQYVLVEQTAAWLALYGNCYWHLLRGSTAGKPVAVQVLRADLVQLIPNEAGKTDYRYNATAGDRPEFPAVDVVHFRRFNPLSSAVGQAPIRVLETLINTAMASDNYNRAFFKGGGIPSTILSTDQDITDDQAKRYDAFWDAWSAQGAVRQRPLKLGKGLKLETPGVSPDTVTVSELPKLIRETICSVLEVPPAIVGIFEYANYANAEMQERLFYSRTVSQYWRRIETALNEQLAPQFGPNLRVRFDRSQVAAFQPNYVELAQAASTLTGGLGVLTPDEARERLFSMQPLDPSIPVRWGAWTTMPQATGDGKPLPMPEAPQPAEAAPQPAKAKALVRLTETQRKALWKAFNQHRDKQAGQIKRRVVEWYGPVTEEVLANLDSAKATRQISRVKAPAIDVLVFALDEGTAQFRQRVLPVLASILEETGQQAVGLLSADVRFNVDSPRARALLASRSQEMKTVVANAQDRLRASLAEGLKAGETVEQLKARVMEWSATGKEYHAENVARTESGIVMNGAALEGYRQGGAQGKEWLSIVDDRSRPHHADLDGTVVGIDEDFDLDGIPCDGPGDPTLGPEDVCQCRCTVAPVVEM